MGICFFVSDLHGRAERYLTLFSRIAEEKPEGVFLGGDLFPGLAGFGGGDFLNDFFVPALRKLKTQLGDRYPRIFLILGNDDNKFQEKSLLVGMDQEHLWEYIHNRRAEFGPHPVYGYNYVPPTPFLNKDWERYDISRYVDPGSVPPEEGRHSLNEPLNLIQFATIKKDLSDLAGESDLSQAIFLFHAPPYETDLDRAALDGKTVEHVPLDLHVGSIAIKQFILKRQPLLTLHGHVHESARLTNSWKGKLGRTTILSAAHDGPELALVSFRLDELDSSSRELIPAGT
jgi:uncharacterized protein